MDIKHLAWSLNDVVHGKPWYWKSVSEIFSTLTLENIHYKYLDRRKQVKILENFWRGT